MPTINRRNRRRREDFAELTGEQRRTLLNGRSFFPEAAFDSVEDLELAWSIHRDELVDGFIAEHPEHRPFAWWLFDHGHERPIVTDTIPPAVAQRHRDEMFGFLHTSIWCCPGWFQEPEPEYLQRMGGAR